MRLASRKPLLYDNKDKTMNSTLSGPAFEPKETKHWNSIYKQDGAHYNIFSTSESIGMEAIRHIFADGEADKFNFCLFSTSGVHGSHQTIEEAEKIWKNGCDEYGDDAEPSVTFLIIQPRLVCMRYGNCIIRNLDDIEFLKKLRASSHNIVLGIGV